MSESTEALFETVRQGCARFLPSTATLLAEWAHGCDSNPTTSATHILKATHETFPGWSAVVWRSCQKQGENRWPRGR